MANDKAPYRGRNESVPFWRDNFEKQLWNGNEWLGDGSIVGHLEPSVQPTADLLLFSLDSGLARNNRLIKNGKYYHVTNIEEYPYHNEITLKILNKAAVIFETNDEKNSLGELTQTVSKIKTARVAFEGISGSIGGARFIQGSQSATVYIFAEIEFDRKKHKLEIDAIKYNITQIIDESGDNTFLRLSLERTE
jgi:hypothetical protein